MKRAEQRPDRQDRQPPRAGRSAAEAGDSPEGGFRERDNRPGRRQRHDHHDKQRFGVVDAVVQVVGRGRPSVPQGDRHEEHDRPQPEHDLHLTQEMQRFAGNAWQGWHAARLSTGIVMMLHRMGQRHETRRQKRVQDRHHEDAGDDQVEGIEGDPRAQNIKEPTARDGGIRAERGRKCSRGLGGNHSGMVSGVGGMNSLSVFSICGITDLSRRSKI